jgi:hypothetical protein
MPEASRKPLLLRIAMRARRDGLSLVQRMYLYGYAVPRLWLSGAIAAPFSVARGHGSFLLLSPGSFLKLAVSGKATISKEYEHYLSLIAAQPLLAALLPSYRFLKGWRLSALQCERLTSVASLDALPLAVDLQKHFDAAGIVQRRLALSDCPQIQVGLRYMETEFGREAACAMRQLVTDYLAHGHYAVGLAHGDFHSRNIMRDAAGCCRVIDLDCIRFQGIREFDAVYFALEQEWSASGRLWTETLGDCLVGAGDNVQKCMVAFGVAWSSGLGLAFFLDRLGQDVMDYGMRYARAHLEPVVEAALRTIAAHSE